jgi:hypothetical protein
MNVYQLEINGEYSGVIYGYGYDLKEEIKQKKVIIYGDDEKNSLNAIFRFNQLEIVEICETEYLIKVTIK